MKEVTKMTTVYAYYFLNGKVALTSEALTVHDLAMLIAENGALLWSEKV